tara:strand:+ start:313 stop:753 length:441 start_codon:yes stop_codon:yes gene_type:complete
VDNQEPAPAHPASIPFEELEVAMQASHTHTYTAQQVEAFAEISGDRNPVHLDEDYAAGTRFNKRLAHGLNSASFFSAIFGTRLPGPGCVYVSQSLNFKRPVHIGDTVVATVTIKKIDEARRRVFFDTICKVKGRVVIDGEAEIYVP